MTGIENLTIDDLPEKYRRIAEIIGVEKLLVLAKEFGGDELYIPQIETLIKDWRDKRIRQEYNGANADELARKYELSVRWVRALCSDLPQNGQLSLFDSGE